MAEQENTTPDPLEAGYYLELYVTEDIDRQAREEGL